MRRPRSAAGLFAATALSLAASAAIASSHGEAPNIKGMPKVDASDLYMFRSYEPGREGYVTILANYIPLQDPAGGPNFFMFDENALYEIHIDNNGDAKEDVTFRFRFTNTSKATALSVGGKTVKIPLIESGPITSVNAATLNVRETYTVDIVRGDRRAGSVEHITKAAGGTGADVFDKPVDNIGQKSLPDYPSYASQHIYDVAIPGCSNGRIFVGQRKEGFYIALGKIFDLINLDDPLGPEVGGNPNTLEGKNVTTLALEIPITCLTAGVQPIIGAWTTSSVRQGRLVNPAPATGLNQVNKVGGAWTQVSRLGMPLVNEAVIGLDDKDKFNASKPSGDAQFLDYVTNPTLPALIQILFPAAVAPNNFPRTDLVAAFLTGIKGVNQPTTVTPSEMLRLNTSIAPTAAAAQSPLGVAGGDTAGFPNGRRPADDIVDVTLRVAMGALCVLTGSADALAVGCNPSNAPAGGLALTDGVRKTAAAFDATFPYLTTPIAGNTQ